MMTSKNFYLRTLDVVVNVYTFCAIQNVVVNVWQLMIMYIQLLQLLLSTRCCCYCLKFNYSLVLAKFIWNQFLIFSLLFFVATYEHLIDSIHIDLFKPHKPTTLSQKNHMAPKARTRHMNTQKNHMVPWVFTVLYIQRIQIFKQIHTICTTNVHTFPLNFHYFVLSTKSNFSIV